MTVARGVPFSAPAQTSEESRTEAGESAGKGADRSIALLAQQVALQIAPEGVAMLFGLFILARLLDEFALKFDELLELLQFPGFRREFFRAVHHGPRRKITSPP
jgi:hypothetical protein